MNLRVVFLAGLVGLFAGEAVGQGVVVFANMKGGVKGPLASPNGLVEDDFWVQLETYEGVQLGEPTQVIGKGMFDGGVMVIEGFSTGEELRVRLGVVHESGSPRVFSGAFYLTLGGAESPAVMSNLNARRAFLKLPYTPPIQVRRLDGGRLELSWPERLRSRDVAESVGQGSGQLVTFLPPLPGSFRTLYASARPDKADAVKIDPNGITLQHRQGQETWVTEVDAAGVSKFFWVAR